MRRNQKMQYLWLKKCEDQLKRENKNVINSGKEGRATYKV